MLFYLALLESSGSYNIVVDRESYGFAAGYVIIHKLILKSFFNNGRILFIKFATHPIWVRFYIAKSMPQFLMALCRLT